MPRRRSPHRAAVDKLRRALRAGQVLALTHCDGGSSFSLEPSGVIVPTFLAKLLVRRRSVAPSPDALFPDAAPQTWVAR